MDKKKSLINVFVSLFFKVVLLFFALLTRRFLIKYIGNEANGLNSLYISIVGVLSIAELGIGTAIVFAMYEPISKGNTQKIAALYNLFSKIYKKVMFIILIAGIVVMPFLPYLAKDYSLDVNLYLSFGLILISVVLSYVYAAKISLINAYKNNYVATTITSLGTILQQIFQIIVLIIFKSFEVYLLCRIIGVIFQWMTTEIYARKNHSDILKLKKCVVDFETKSGIYKNTKAMFMHRIGGLLVNTVDSIVISTFIGVEILGKYSNYTLIITQMALFLGMFFAPLTSIIGHFCVKNDPMEKKRYFDFFHTFNFFVGLIFYICYYAAIDSFITICFGDNLHLNSSITFVITVNYFIQFMRKSVLLFRDATGTFYHDRWKPMFEGVLNLILSIVFVKLFNESYAVVGVLVATIITNILICHIIEPYVLYKHVFKQTPKKYFVKNYLYIIVFVLLLSLTNVLSENFFYTSNIFLSFVCDVLIGFGVSIIPCVLLFFLDKNFASFSKKILQFVFRKTKKT